MSSALKLVLVLKRSLNRDFLIGWIICLKSPIDAKNYAYKINVEGKMGDKFTFEGIICFPDAYKDQVQDGDCHFSMPMSTVNRFMDDEKSLSLDVEIRNM